MKKYFLFFIVPMILGTFSCTEIGPTVTPSGSDRIVLIEEFTGVQCVNCPLGSEQIEALLESHGDNLVAVSIHAGSFSHPYPDSQHDFRTEEGTSLETMLGPPIGYPIAAINRKVFPDELEIMLGKNKWAGYIEQEKAIQTKVNIDLDKNFDADTRQLDITAKLSFVETITAPLRLTVMLVENGVKDLQLTPEGKDYEYTHKHILRDMMTNFDGNDYTGGSNEGDTGEQSFGMVIPQEWNVENCSVIVSLHQYQGDRDVLQAAQIGVLD